MADFVITNRGVQELLEEYFRQGSSPADFQVALFNDTAVEGDELTDLTGEQSGTGYAMQTIARDATGTGWPTLAVNGSGNYQVESMEVQFTATDADWIAVKCIALIANLGTNRLIGFCNVPTQTPANGESIYVTVKIYGAQA